MRAWGQIASVVVLGIAVSGAWADESGPKPTKPGFTQVLNGALIITQSVENHKLVTAFIEKLRKEKADEAAAEPGKMVALVYGMRDLVDATAGSSWRGYWDLHDPNALNIPGLGQTEQEAAERKRLTDSLVKQAKRIDPNSWLPDPWRDNGTIRVQGNDLIITQTPANHARIGKLIPALRCRGYQVRVTIRFFQFSKVRAKAERDNLAAWLRENAQSRSNEKTGTAALSGEQAEGLIKLFAGLEGCRQLNAPRVSLYDGQRTCVTVCREEVAMLPNLGKDANKVPVRIPIGVCFEIKTFVRPDGRSFACGLRTWLAERTRQGDTPTVALTERAVDFSTPDKSLMLVRMPRREYEVTGAR